MTTGNAMLDYKLCTDCILHFQLNDDLIMINMQEVVAGLQTTQ